MAKLLTGNIGKYKDIESILKDLSINIIISEQKISEIQDLDPLKVISHKAREARNIMGFPCLVDDTTLTFKSFKTFPGTYTSDIIKSLGARGFMSLVKEFGKEVTLTCRIAIDNNGAIKVWEGSTDGTLKVKLVKLEKGKAGYLSNWFFDENGQNNSNLHRKRALHAFSNYNGDNI